jgi:hypothetical protein
VSDNNNWNWAGENPDEWYPLDLRFTVVVVAKGSTFSGWDYWLNRASSLGAANATAPPSAE